MKASAVKFTCALLLFAALYTSCTLPAPSCTPADLVAPESIFPVWETIDTFSPSLTWDFPAECEPDHYIVEWRIAYESGFSDTSPGDTTSFTISPALNPATEYVWKVAAVADGVEGPFSDTEIFWTGPVCFPDSLVAPTIVDPVDLGVETTAAWQALVWDYPDSECLPDYYIAELRPATDPSFSGPNLMDEPSSGPPDTRQIPMALLDDCSGYIWRVKAVVGTAHGPWSEPARFHTDYAGACDEESVYDFFPTCPTADLLSPTGIYPPNFASFVDLIPSFSWDYPELCFPEGYRIEITTFGDYSEGTIEGGTGNPSQSWAPAGPLEPATRYEWRVAPINGFDLGPFSTSLSFRTGPVCATPDLVAPVLDTPGNGSEVHDLRPWLHWHYPDTCLPESFEWYLTTDHTFTTYDDYLDSGRPIESILFDENLSDCTIYFWRVRGNNPDGPGPFSDTFNFYTNLDGSCPSVEPPPPSEIITCSTITDAVTCNSYSHCHWAFNSSSCQE